jgi:Mg-chelatase subunit ChlI
MVTKDLKFTSPVFPFTAIVGQEEMKLALQLNVLIQNRWSNDYG